MDGTSAYSSDTCQQTALAQMTAESLAPQPCEITFVDRNGDEVRLGLLHQPDSPTTWDSMCQAGALGNFGPGFVKSSKKMMPKLRKKCVVVWWVLNVWLCGRVCQCRKDELWAEALKSTQDAFIWGPIGTPGRDNAWSDECIGDGKNWFGRVVVWWVCVVVVVWWWCEVVV